jgi:hypothetical protein
VAHGAHCEADTLPVFFNSFSVSARKDTTKLVVFTGSMPTDVASKIFFRGGTVVRVPADFGDPGNKQRHWYFAQYLATHHRELRYVLTVDARDTVFQGDPFSFDLDDRLVFSAEDGLLGDDKWCSGDVKNLAKELRKQCYAPSSRARIINGGLVAGPAALMASFQLTRFAADMRAGKGTDQATLTALVNWTRDWPSVRVVGPDEPWAYHGHWAEKRGLTLNDHGHALCDRDREYLLFHQWDRHPEARALLLDTYGGW